MDKSKVPLPSATKSEQQTIFEIQTASATAGKIPQVAENQNKSSVEVVTIDTQSENSESDNEGVDEIDSVIQKVDRKVINLDDEFENICASKSEDSGLLETNFDTGVLETDIDAVDREIVEILSGEKINVNDAIDVKNIAETAERNDDKIDNIATESTHTEEKEDIAEKTSNNEDIKTTEEILKESQSDKKFSRESSEKPSVPIQTYLWEDIKRAKEQGGYPWTHLYKQPLGEDGQQHEVILTYRRSPKSGRRSDSDAGTPKSQKKQVRIQDENIEIQNTEALSDNENLDDVEKVDDDDDDEEPSVDLTELTDDVVKLPEAAAVKKSPKSILKRSQKIFDNIKPSTPKFDSDSLKKKFKNPLQKIKKMADEQILKVKSIKKIPVNKNEIVLQEKVEILKLKESPKSQHREVASFIVKQDSDDIVDIVELEQSPSEARKNRALVTPDEIISLPVSTDNKSQETDSCKKEGEKPTKSKRKEHHDEDIEDYISKIASDTENVERATFQGNESQDEMLKQQDNITDPIFDEFSRELNKKIRKSLSLQDDSIHHELVKSIPKIDELAKQISGEDCEEKIEEPTKSPHLFAPISSIDSTSSEEDRKAQLAKESEASDSNTKKSNKIISQPVSTENKPQETHSREKPTKSKRKERHDEDIEDYISKIASDTENVERATFQGNESQDEMLKQQDNITDPIFDEFSRELNKRIRKSLSSQDDSIHHELVKSIPKISELAKQISYEDREEKIEEPTKLTKESEGSDSHKKKLDKIVSLPVSTDNKSQETHSYKKENEKPTKSKRKEHHYEDIEDYISKIASDTENVERATFQDDESQDEMLKQQDNITDPIFDEFSRELNKKIRKSLSSQDDSIHHELVKSIPKISELAKQISYEDHEENIEEPIKLAKESGASDSHKKKSGEIISQPVSTENKPQETHSPKKPTKSKRKEHHYEDIEDYISKIASDTENVERATFQGDMSQNEKLKRQDNITDPIFDEFSRELNKKIRKSLSSQDDSIHHELMKRIPKIEELAKQISDEDREEKIEEPTKSTHLLAPISSIDSTSSEEDRKAQLSMVAEESEASDSHKKKSFDEPSVDIMDVESLQIDESDVSTLIDDDKILVNEQNVDEKIENVLSELEDAIKETNLVEEIKIEEPEKRKIEELEKSQDKIDESQTVEDLDVKEDIEIKSTKKTINPKWAKMRKRIEDLKILRGQCKLLKHFKQCFRSF